MENIGVLEQLDLVAQGYIRMKKEIPPGEKTRLGEFTQTKRTDTGELVFIQNVGEKTDFY